MPRINWQALDHDANRAGEEAFAMGRTKVPGGWLVMMYMVEVETLDVGLRGAWGYGLGGLTFVPDPQHEWDGNSLE